MYHSGINGKWLGIGSWDDDKPDGLMLKIYIKKNDSDRGGCSVCATTTLFLYCMQRKFQSKSREEEKTNQGGG